MRSLINKPALVAAFIMACGIASAKYFSFPIFPLVVIVSLLSIFSIVHLFYVRRVSGREKIFSPFILPLLFFSSSLLYRMEVSNNSATHISNYCNTDSLTIFCKIVDEPITNNGRTKALVQVLSLKNEFDSIGVNGKTYLTIISKKTEEANSKNLEYGAFIQFRSVLQSPPTEKNPGEFSYKEYLALNNIYALTTVLGFEKIEIIGEAVPNPFFKYGIFPAKKLIIRTITTVMKGDEANFLIGLLLGDRTELSEEIKTAFMNTGTIHVLAVSGSHVILVVAIIYFVFGLLRVPHRPKIIATIFALIFYTYLTGATPSVVRASIMSGIVLLGKFFEQKTDSYNVLGLSAVIIFLFDPKQLFDVGFQLSFSAVFSLVYFYPKLHLLIKNIPEKYEEFKIISWLLKGLAVSVAAQVGTIPFTAYYFGKVSLISFVANLFVVPLVEIIVTIGLSGAMFGIFSLWIASCFSEVNNLISIITLQLVKFAEQIPYAIINTATFGVKETIFYSVAVFWLFNLRNSVVQKKLIFVTMITVTVIIFSSLFETEQKPLRITFLDVGQGDAAVIEFPSGEVFVVDAGPITETMNAGEKIVAPFLRKRGISKIDAIISSHPHADHIGGVPYLLKNFEVVTTINSAQRAQTVLFADYEQQRANTQNIPLFAGAIFGNIANVRMYALHPTKQFLDTDSSNGYNGLNESSIVFKLQYGNTSFLFTGDAEIPAEEHIAELYGEFLKCDVLKAGHHGSSTSSSEIFLQYSAPKFAVISVGKFNKFRHPSKFVLKRFEQNTITICRTDNEGAIIFESDGNKIKKVEWRTDK